MSAYQAIYLLIDLFYVSARWYVCIKKGVWLVSKALVIIINESQCPVFFDKDYCFLQVFIVFLVVSICYAGFENNKLDLFLVKLSK